MASDLNRVLLIGNLTRDPEQKQTQNGKQYCKFSIANNRTYTVDGTKNEDTSFFNCVAFGRLSEIIVQYCQKGKQVAIEGRLTQRSWDSQDGKKSIVEITVENLQLLGGKRDSGSGNDYRNEGPPKAGHGYDQDMADAFGGEVLPEDDDIPF